MSKDIQEAIERLNRFKTIKIMYGNTFAMHLEQLNQLQEDLETVLNYIENSIPTEVIEEKIKYEKEKLTHYGEYEKLNILEKINVDLIDNRIEVLQDLLENK